MLYAGLDLSRKRLDFHLLDEAGGSVEVGAQRRRMQTGCAALPSGRLVSESRSWRRSSR